MIRVRPSPLLTLVHWGIFAMLAAFLIFAHGCHGDEDTELFSEIQLLGGP